MNTIRDNKTSEVELVSAAGLIQNEYPKMPLNVMKDILLDGLAQKWNKTDTPHYPNMPTVLFWFRQWKLDITKHYNYNKRHQSRLDSCRHLQLPLNEDLTAYAESTDQL